ncbi:hypothetical protein GCM10010343_20020 [Streptomyces avidinii]|nr:hypothetical protein GCM10010343_20020 [Streptomyces avidinii]
MATIAVTGHVNLTGASVAPVAQALFALLARHPAAELTGMSCLAPGADTVFAEASIPSTASESAPAHEAPTSGGAAAVDDPRNRRTSTVPDRGVGGGQSADRVQPTASTRSASTGRSSAKSSRPGSATRTTST